MARATTPDLSPNPDSSTARGKRPPVFTPVALLTVCALLVLTQLYATIPLVPTVDADLGEGNASAAVGTAFALAYATGFLFFGPLSDHYGRKRILIPGLVVLALATACLTIAPSLIAIALLRAVQGFVAGSFAPAALAYLMEALPPRWRTTAVGAMSTAFLTAGIIGQVYASTVALAWSWRWVFGLAAPAIAAIALAMAALLREPPREPVSGTLGERFRQMGRLVTRREIALLCVAHLSTLLAFVAMYSALGPHLQTLFGLHETDIIWVRLAALPGMLVAPFSGALIGRFGATRMAIVGFVLAALGAAGESLASGSLWALIGTSIVFVAGIATAVPAMISLFGDRAEESRAAGIALNGFMLFAGASIGPLTSQLGLGFETLLYALCGTLLAAAALVTASRPNRVGPSR